jgi:hypothetical protein
MYNYFIETSFPSFTYLPVKAKVYFTKSLRQFCNNLGVKSLVKSHYVCRNTVVGPLESFLSLKASKLNYSFK